MMATAITASPPLRPTNAFVAAMLAAARIQQRRWASNVILLVRRPLTPALVFISLLLAYRISGQTTVPEDQVVGFLIVGTLAVQAWNATVWSCGFALQMDAFQGTLPAVLASPASRIAIVLGYGLGDLVLSAPAVLVTLAIGLGYGAEFNVANPLLAGLMLGMVFVSALTIGVACSGLFILSRNANPLANFLQTPVYILAGFYFPRSVLPDWLAWVGGLLPITHALAALRASMLEGAGWGDLRDELGIALLTSALFLLLGIWSLRRVDHELRRTGSLNLF
jgi:ABC-2 type transport system permease protein